MFLKRIKKEDLCEEAEKKDTIEIAQLSRNYPTKTAYSGEWDNVEFCGYGTYTYPNGTIYDGEFKNGQFHGKGKLTYPMGQIFYSIWENGKMIGVTKYIFKDKLIYEEPWEYCKMPDRRFMVEILTDFKPPYREFLTNKQPTRQLPKRTYDTEDGFYSSRCKYIFYPKDSMHNQKLEENFSVTKIKKPTICGTVKRVPDEKEVKWIKDNCRKSWETPVGYRPQLYEKWITGRNTELLNNNKQ